MTNAHFSRTLDGGSDMELLQIIMIVFVAAGLCGIIAQALNLPLIIAYLATGLIIGPFGLNIIPLDGGSIEGLTALGIAFMLFLVGLELDISKIKNVGIVSFIITFWQILLVTLAGYVGATILGFGVESSLYIGLALSFSSTVVVIKNLSDSNQLASLHGRILVGILLTQDIIAICALILLQDGNTGGMIRSATGLVSSLIIFGASAYIVRRFIISWLFELFAKSTELIFIASIAWALFLTVLSGTLGFSPAIGAFIAGVTLATVPYADEIRGRVRWLRDFFIVLFLSLVGAKLIDNSTQPLLVPVLVFSGIVIIGKIFFTLLLMGISGFRRRTSFMVGVSISQVSEFSLIFIAMLATNGKLDPGISTIILLTTILTMALSSLLITKSNRLYHFFSESLKFFERTGRYWEDYHAIEKKMSDHVILFGAHRVGYPVLKQLTKLEREMIVVDYDPTVIKKLREQSIPALYGDMGDPELVDHLNLEHAKMVISTTHDYLDTQAILKKSRSNNTKTIVFVTATTIQEALLLYDEGADYVLLPHRLSGEYLADIIANVKEHAPKTTQESLEHRKKQHITELTRLLEKEIPA